MEKTCQSWRKSTYSNATSGNCVEVGHTDGRIGIRDTKDLGVGPVLRVPADVWTVFTAPLKSGRREG